MNLLPKSEPAKLEVLLALAAKRRRAALVRRIVAACAEGLGLVGLLVLIVALSCGGEPLRSLPYSAQVLIWLSWTYAAFAWSALRVQPLFDRDEARGVGPRTASPASEASSESSRVCHESGPGVALDDGPMTFSPDADR